jgi:hypothetical protein
MQAEFKSFLALMLESIRHEDINAALDIGCYLIEYFKD